jgi:hypothetical protein
MILVSMVFFMFSVGARELVSESETRSRAFICNCSCCSLGTFH